MGTRAREIVDMDVEKLIDLLNRAFSDEWLAHYQYWIGAQVAKGPMRTAVSSEFLEHSKEEFNHAQMLSDRIVALGGLPALRPQDWFNLTNCGYDPPDNQYVKNVLEQNLRGEQCAIKTYDNLLKIVRDRDPITYNLIIEILDDEIEHETDLQSILEDISMMEREMSHAMA